MSEEEFVIRASDSLKLKVGMPMSAVFTDSKIKAAEKVIEDGIDTFISRCIEDARKMRETFKRLNDTGDLTISSITSLKILSLGIKSLAGQAGYPIASDIARLMYEFLEKIKEMDPKSVKLIGFHIDAIYAVFNESRTGLQDAVTREVLERLKAVANL